MADDDVLLRLFAEKHSEDAFGQLVSRHLGFVYAAALRLLAGDAHRAEDIAQAVFIELATQAHRLKSHPSLTGWLYVTTRNLAVKWIRSERRRKTRERAFEETRTSDHSVGQNSDWDRLSPVLDQAICELKPPEREALLLRFFRGQPFADIAKIQRMNEDGARMRVNRALERLRQKLEIHGFVSTTAALSVALSDHPASALPEALRQTVMAAVLAKGSAGVSALTSFLMSTTKVKIAAGFVLTGLGLLFWEQHRVQALSQDLATLQRGNATLQRMFEAEGQRANPARALANSPVANPTAATAAAEEDATPLGPPTSATSQASAGLLSDGRVTWGGKVVRLNAFMANLVQFRRDHPEATAQILVDAQGCTGYELMWVLDEARKQGVNAWLGPDTTPPQAAGLP